MDSYNEEQKSMLDALAAAAIRIFRPLVRILIRNGVSFRTCSDWLRWCYADVAMREFTIPGRKQTKSRVAVLTGLTRVDVDKLLDMPPPDQTRQAEQFHRAGLVLSGWANDPRYRDRDDRLMTLPFDSEEGPSFSELVSRFSGGAPPRAVLDELELNQAVEILPDHRVRILRPRYITRADELDVTNSQILGLACGELINTINYNWQPGQDGKRLQLVAYNRNISPALADEAKDRIEDKARALIEDVDALLYEYELRSREIADTGSDSRPRTRTLGMGAYYFQRDPEAP